MTQASSSAPPTPEYSHTIVVKNVPEAGLDIKLQPSDDVLELIAKRFKIPAIASLIGDFRVLPTPHGAKVEGDLVAVLTRECVASLEHITEAVREDIDVEFDRRVIDGDEADIMEQLAQGQFAEPLPGPDIDLGEFLIQQLSLAMDPFPRKPDAKPLSEIYGVAQEPSPFDALKALKSDIGDD